MTLLVLFELFQMTSLENLHETIWSCSNAEAGLSTHQIQKQRIDFVRETSLINHSPDA